MENEKKKIRSLISQQKKQMLPGQIEELSEQLTILFLNLEEYRKSDIIFSYISFNQEVRTEAIIRQSLSDGKKVAVPRVEGEDLVFHYINDMSQCLPGAYGILEPDPSLPEARLSDGAALMLMPGIAFDRRGSRIGYGKGLYDRYLSRQNCAAFCRIALCYDFQLIGHIDADEFDIPVNTIISAPSGDVIAVSPRDSYQR